MNIFASDILTEIKLNESDVFLTSNFRRVLNVLCFLLGNSPATEIRRGELPRRNHEADVFDLDETERWPINV